MSIFASMIRHFYLSNRFFVVFSAIAVFFVVSFFLHPLFWIAVGVLVLALAVVIADTLLLFGRTTRIKVTRLVPKLLSLGDDNSIYLHIDNQGKQNYQLRIIDELPEQLQIRDMVLFSPLAANELRKVNYSIKPTERGEYQFGAVNLYVSSIIGLVQRRIQAGEGQMVPTYPSVIQMKKYELKAMRQIANNVGIKKIRRLGHSYEFEQIKNYVAGDDIRTINWRASGRRGALMVNQYEDERSQQVYCIIDRSRVMRMPFNGLTLIDHSVNSVLALSNIILQKKDRVGLLSFSDKLGSTVPADNNPNQLGKVLNALYNEKEGKGEASYELLYYSVRKLIRGRSLLLLYSNFESLYALDRVLPTLRQLNKSHLLVVVFFQNTEIEDFANNSPVLTTEDIYNQTAARQYNSDKVQMVQQLRQFGIQTILTRPEDLSLNTINKYLELKSRGLI